MATLTAATIYLANRTSASEAFNISNDDVEVYGSSSIYDNISIMENDNAAFSATNVTVGSTIEKVFFANTIESYTFKQGFGSNLEVHEMIGGQDVLIATITDVAGKKIAFSPDPTNEIALAYTTDGHITIDGRTVINDNTAPTLSSSIPAEDSTLVAESSNIVLTFSEAVTAVADKMIFIKTTDGDVTIETIAAKDTDLVTISNGVVTIDPRYDFAADTGYYVLIDNGAFKDASNNVYAGITSTTALSFTTAAIDAEYALTTGPDTFIGGSGDNLFTAVLNNSISTANSTVLAPENFTAVAIQGDATTTETHTISIPNIYNAGETITIGGLTFTATSGMDSEVLAAAFADLAPGATEGNAEGIWSGQLSSDWSSAPYNMNTDFGANGPYVTFTSTTPNANVPDIVITAGVEGDTIDGGDGDNTLQITLTDAVLPLNLSNMSITNVQNLVIKDVPTSLSYNGTITLAEDNTFTNISLINAAGNSAISGIHEGSQATLIAEEGFGSTARFYFTGTSTGPVTINDTLEGYAQGYFTHNGLINATEIDATLNFGYTDVGGEARQSIDVEGSTTVTAITATLNVANSAPSMHEYYGSYNATEILQDGDVAVTANINIENSDSVTAKVYANYNGRGNLAPNGVANVYLSNVSNTNNSDRGTKSDVLLSNFSEINVTVDDTTTMNNFDVSEYRGGAVNDPGIGFVTQDMTITANADFTLTEKFDLAHTGTNNLVVNGSGNVDLGYYFQNYEYSLVTSTTIIDASALTGDFSIKIGTAVSSVSGGDGNDTITFINVHDYSPYSEQYTNTVYHATSPFTANTVVSGGEGTDMIGMSYADYTNVVAEKISGFEGLTITNALANASTVTPGTISGITAFFAGNGVKAEAVATVSELSDGMLVAMGGNLTENSGTLNLAMAAGSNTLTLGLNSSYDNTEASIYNSITCNVEADATTLHVISTATNTSKTTSDNEVFVQNRLNLTDDALISLTIAGDRNFLFSSSATQASLTTIDAHENTGGVNINASNLTQALTITGSNNDSNITGGSGDDAITGGAGYDILNGGAGDDTFTYDVGAGVMPSQDTIDGGDGIDTISAWNGAGDAILVDEDFANVTNMEKIFLASASLYSVTLGANSNAAFTNGITVTSQYEQSLILNGALSTVAITATGGDFNDTITGGSAADTITGGLGADTITGGKGIDNLTGGLGADTFVMTTSSAGTLTVVQSAATTIQVTGTYNAGDVITIQHFSPFPDVFYSYEVQAGDTNSTIASGLSAALGTLSAGSEGDTITTNFGLNTAAYYGPLIASYQADTIMDFETGLDVLELSAASLNKLLGTNPTGSAANWVEAHTLATLYVDGDTGATVGFMSFHAESTDAAATNTAGQFIYNAVTGKLYLDQSGDTTWTDLDNVLTDAAGDDILIATVGTIVDTDIFIVA